jgi:phospholipid/cholesterol/gamma-HCH transport system substrate-binding protein
MKNRTAQNLRLGIFIITGIVIFVLAVYFIGNKQNLFGKNTRIVSVFKNVGGLQNGNNVRYAGVNVGTVKDITILNDTSIVVDMLITEKAIGLIKKDSKATINSDGLVGSMVVNLIPGESPDSARIMPGDTIESISKIATADMLSTLNTTNENAALLTADLLKITNAINDGKGTLGTLLKDEKMASDIKQSIANLKVTTQRASATINRFNSLLSDVNIDSSVAGVLLKDTVAAKKLKAIFVSLEESANEIDSMTVNLKMFSEEIRTGEGVLNFVLNDTTFVNRLESTIENAESASKKMDENMEALQHNFLFRGYFRRLERKRALEEQELKD